MKTEMMKGHDTNQKKQIKMRAKYMDDEITYEEYYAWLADFIGATKRMVPVTKEELLKSADPHLNDIPLSVWDGVYPRTQTMAGRKSLAWSLSDNICVLKELARQIIKEGA